MYVLPTTAIYDDFYNKESCASLGETERWWSYISLRQLEVKFRTTLRVLRNSVHRLLLFRNIYKNNKESGLRNICLSLVLLSSF